MTLHDEDAQETLELLKQTERDEDALLSVAVAQLRLLDKILEELRTMNDIPQDSHHG